MSRFQDLQKSKQTRAARLLDVLPRISELALHNPESFKEKLVQFLGFVNGLDKMVAEQRTIVASDSPEAQRLDSEAEKIRSVKVHINLAIRGETFDPALVRSLLMDIQSHHSTLKQSAA